MNNVYKEGCILFTSPTTKGVSNALDFIKNFRVLDSQVTAPGAEGNLEVEADVHCQFLHCLVYGRWPIGHSIIINLFLSCIS